MMYLLAIVVILLVLLIAFYTRESFGSCKNCEDIPLRKVAPGVVNPFVYPYSATECVYDLYPVTNAPVPLTHLTTPDHVELV